MRDLVFLSLEPWDEIWRRNQFVVDLLVRRNLSLRVLFVAPASNVAKRATRLKDVAGPFSHLRPLPTHDRVFLAQPTKLPFESRRFVRGMNNIWQSAALRRWTAQLGMRRPMLWINDHYRAHLARGSRRGPVVYDITDDWITAAPPGFQRDSIARHDAELCRASDATIVCSERLVELKMPLVRSPSRLHLVPNGVHLDHYASVRDRSIPVPPATTAWPRPVYGYTGTVHTERVDVSLVERVAQSLSTGSMVFVGPNHLDEASRRRLEATGRVIFAPPVPYAKIPDYMRAMDVMMVPHRVSEFVESLNPIKLWEYLASGLPIVSTPVAGFRDFSHVVTLAPDAASFALALQTSLGESSERPAARIQIAAAHSWENRVERIEKVLQDCDRVEFAHRQAAPVLAASALIQD